MIARCPGYHAVTTDLVSGILGIAGLGLQILSTVTSGALVDGVNTLPDRNGGDMGLNQQADGTATPVDFIEATR